MVVYLMSELYLAYGCCVNAFAEGICCGMMGVRFCEITVRVRGGSGG